MIEVIICRTSWDKQNTFWKWSFRNYEKNMKVWKTDLVKRNRLFIELINVLAGIINREYKLNLRHENGKFPISTMDIRGVCNSFLFSHVCKYYWGILKIKELLCNIRGTRHLLAWFNQQWYYKYSFVILLSIYSIK